MYSVFLCCETLYCFPAAFVPTRVVPGAEVLLDVAGPTKGLFTSTNPELRRVIPEVNGRVKVKVVYTVLEAQYQSALTAAVQAINASNKTVCFELVGYLLEELRDSTNFETFQKDLKDANVFIGSLIFIEELAEKVRQAIVS